MSKKRADKKKGNSGGTVLKPEGVIDCGVNIIEENPSMPTTLHFLVNDDDFTSIYPTLQVVLNACKETLIFALKAVVLKNQTEAEALAMDKGITASMIFDIFGHLIDLKSNSVYLCKTYFGLPDFVEMEKILKKTTTNLLINSE